MTSLATPAQLGAWVSQSLDTDTRAAAVLDHASALIRTEAGLTWESGTIPDGIPQLTVRVAARFWLNPSGLQSSTTGPFSGTFGEMQLTAAEKQEIWQILNPGKRRGIGTISTTRGPIETRNVTSGVGTETWIDVAGQAGEPLPASVPL